MRKKVAAILAVVTVIFMIWGFAFPAQAAPGDKFSIGIKLSDTEAVGSYQVAGIQAFCIDLNGAEPLPVSGWRKTKLSVEDHKQTGMDKSQQGFAAAVGATFSQTELAQLAWLTNHSSKSDKNPVLMAATEILVRQITAGDAAQQKDVERRLQAAQMIQPKLISVIDQLRVKMLQEVGPYRLEVKWEQTPSQYSAGKAQVKLYSQANQELPFNGEARWEGQPVAVVDGWIEVPALPTSGVTQTLQVRAQVPDVTPQMLVPQNWTRNGSDDAKSQRMIFQPKTVVIETKLEAKVEPEPTPESTPEPTPEPTVVPTPEPTPTPTLTQPVVTTPTAPAQPVISDSPQSTSTAETVQPIIKAGQPQMPWYVITLIGAVGLSGSALIWRW